MPDLDAGSWITLGVAAVAVLFGGWLIAAAGPAWLKMRRAGLRTGFGAMASARLRRLDVDAVSDAAITLHQVGVATPPFTIEVHALAGGDVRAVAEALAHAKNAGTPAAWAAIRVSERTRR